MHCKKERVVLTNFGHLSCTQNCCKLLGKVRYPEHVSAHKPNPSSRKWPLECGVDSRNSECLNTKMESCN